jgi:acyl-ACP thioesterase
LCDLVLPSTLIEERRVNVKRGEQLLVTAKTEWCMLDAQTMRPKRVTAEFIKPFFE